jgi:hypothetical protein
MADHLFFKILDEITGSNTDQNCHISVPQRIYRELMSMPPSALLSKSLLTLNLIELLSQYQSGRLHKKGTHKRFDRFLQEHTPLQQDQRSILYLFRNAVIHNGGAYASTKDGSVYRFKLKESGALIEKESRVFYSIGIAALESLLHSILESVADALQRSSDYRNRFLKVHKAVGCSHSD